MVLKQICSTLALSAALSVFAASVAPAQMNAAPAATAPAGAPGVLSKEATSPLVPPAVFFAGQVASTQGRNSGAVRLPGDHYIVATLVDTSGYSSSIQQKYQAYLIAETTLTVNGHTLPAGAYGCGFIADDQFIVMDIGGGTLFTVKSTRDAEMRRPTPLQIVAAPDGGGYRLYAGRSFVTLRQK